VVKLPPTYKSSPPPSSQTPSTNTRSSTPVPDGRPGADHALPPHLATWSTVTPPAVVKRPPAYSASPDPSSHTASTSTSSFTPVPDGPASADHALPFHFAMRFTGTPPAHVKPPPTYNASPPPSSHTANASTSPFTP